jgi:hypothetical protein
MLRTRRDDRTQENNTYMYMYTFGEVPRQQKGKTKQQERKEKITIVNVTTLQLLYECRKFSGYKTFLLRLLYCL